MPIYLLHGFRWPRTPIREFTIVNNVEEAASDYIMSRGTPEAFRDAFAKNWPEVMAGIPNISFIEQYDPQEPKPEAYAYVADVVIERHQDIDVDKARENGPPAAAWEAFADLRDKLLLFARQFNATTPDFNIGWYAVYNGDPDRLQDEYQRESGESSERGSKVFCSTHFKALTW
ncbi:hypothetical protein MMC21_003132 [Puttea exsequens]|nr:hypothetical protein [Puttea exsequens]